MLGWVIGAIGALALALLFARLARRKPMAGGPATYAFDAFGRFWGSQSSLWYWAACLIGNVAIATAASSYLANFFGISAGPVQGAMFTVLLLWLVTLVNLVSPRFVGQFDGLLLDRRPDSAAAGGHDGLDRRSTARSSASRGM